MSQLLTSPRPRVLHLEDDKTASDLCREELARAGIEFDYELVCTSIAFKERVRTQEYDLILADYRLPGWTGIDALRRLRSSGYKVPFILITGTLEDDLAAESIKEGATDYVLKENLDRLPRTFRRALEESTVRAGRDQAENELHDSEKQYKLLFDANPLPMLVFNLEHLNFLAVNEAAVRHYGYSRLEFFAMTLSNIQPEKDIPAFLESISHSAEEFGDPEPWKHIKKDGNLIDVEITSHDLTFQGRRSVLVLAQDVTELNRKREMLRASEERFFKIFRSIPLAVTISTRAEGRYLDVNEEFLRLVGYSREDVIGHTATELRYWLDPQEQVAMIQQLSESGRVIGLQIKLRTRSGDIRLIEISSELIELDGSACVLAISHDITDAKRLEEQFRQAQKMEAIGRLAGGVAHDFNNMLSVIIGYGELLQERVRDGAERKGIDEIKKAAQRAAGLTRQLLAFSRQQVLSPRVLDFNAVVENVSTMLRRMIGEDVELVVAPGDSIGSVRADPAQIEQIIMNLAVNARDAMPRGGKLVITTGNADIQDDTYISHYPSPRPGRYVLLVVSDTGAGIDEQTMLHIFEPFYTTKDIGKGTGLGLSTVHGVVTQSGGFIWVYSELGKGTTFKIYLPRVDEPASADLLNVDSPPVGGSETILLVEDEESVRVLVSSLLKESGYTVLPAADGNEAVRLAKECGQVELMVTDVVMPGTNGMELGTALKAIFPNLKVLYISGYTSDLITQHGGLETVGMLLEKPFTRRSLLSKVRTTLDRR